MIRGWLRRLTWGRSRSESLALSAAEASDREVGPTATYRPRYGDCPWCKAPEDRWCTDGCPLLDSADYR